MLCENCGEPVVPDRRPFRGATGWWHDGRDGTRGRLWCGHGLTKAQPIVCSFRGCDLPATVHPRQLGACDAHAEVG
jgi:hypothetical protein